MSERLTKSFGNRVQDEEIDRLWAEIRAIKNAVVPTEQTIQQVIQQAAPSIIMTQTDETIYLYTDGVEIDQATGLTLTENGNLGKVAITLLTTKGDLFTFGTANARQAVGNNGELLIADSAQANGLKWANPWDFARLTAGNETLTSDNGKRYVRVFNDGVTGRTLTLPSPTTHRTPICVRALTAPAGGHTLARNGSESIDGTAANLTMGTAVGQVSEIGLISDGTNWYSFYRRTL